MWNVLKNSNVIVAKGELFRTWNAGTHAEVDFSTLPARAALSPLSKVNSEGFLQRVPHWATFQPSSPPRFNSIGSYQLFSHKLGIN
jgi:hypothetical protein